MLTVYLERSRALGHWRRADDARGDLHVLFLHRSDHILRSQTA